MSPGSARYRVRQLLDARAARRDPPDDGPARALLPPPLFDAFRQMPAEDRRHVLTVLADLRDRESDPALLQAALLHDLGKAGAGVGLIHRVARVLLWRAWPRAWAWLSARPTGWRRPFWVVARHPERGALWVEALGGSPELVALIRHHEAPAPAAWQGQDLARWHAALAWADARS